MADLTRNAPLRFRFPTLLKMERFTLDNSAAQTVYRGQPMVLDVSADTVNPRAWVAATTLVGSVSPDKFVGIANEPANVLTTDLEAANEIQIITGGEVGFKSTVFTDADLGRVVGFSDSGTLVATVAGGAANRCPIGILTRVVDGYAYVELNAPTILSF